MELPFSRSAGSSGLSSVASVNNNNINNNNNITNNDKQLPFTKAQARNIWASGLFKPLRLLVFFLASLFIRLFGCTNKLSVERHNVFIEGLPPRLNGLKICQLSDIHVDVKSTPVRIQTTLLRAALQQIAEEKPDLVCLTGDFVQKQPEAITALVPLLSSLRSGNRCVVGVLGNHDHKHNRYSDQEAPRQICRALEQGGISMLVNQKIYPFGPGFAVVGVDDLWSPQFRPEAIEWSNEPTLLLAHNPDTAVSVRQHRVDLQLSGHTHGGQIALPLLGPVIALIKRVHDLLPGRLQGLVPGRRHFHVVKNWNWASGWGRCERTNGGINLIYTNRGLASHPPGRFWCAPELTVFTLHG